MSLAQKRFGMRSVIKMKQKNAAATAKYQLPRIEDRGLLVELE